ncbi:MAG: TIGR00730 family Rossman fold protein [Nitrospinae bacterium CG11_big_fil_rev_8_21_14_0_20_56_8]|nr:MAG: TIGR00730 family Rossman fold protein [Nitrospinae bacterium CG11_big_fil_rev_8_21_14_0_20_56_8]
MSFKNNQPYQVNDDRANELIEELAQRSNAPGCKELVRQILTTVVKLSQEYNDLGEFKLINVALKELRHAFRIFLPYREVRKVAVFGSARIPRSDPCYQITRDLCDHLVDKGFMVISGAGGGIMAAANEGAGREKSFGVNIKLPFEQKPNSFIDGDSKLIEFKYFFTRKLIFIKESSATVLLPGGFGTLDEGFENLTLFQTGKCLPRPIVLLEPPGGTYWKHWMEFIKEALVRQGFISPQDMHLLHLTHSPEEAAEMIDTFYRIYHSLRYVGNLTVLRFLRTIPQEIIDRLNREFKDILTDGEIRSSGPLGDEIRKNECLALPRLVMNFDKRNFGRLNELIMTINRITPL